VASGNAAEVDVDLEEFAKKIGVMEPWETGAEVARLGGWSGRC
jgi:hypothetical protein